MSIEGQGHFLTIYFPGFVCFVLYKAKISGERLQDHLSSGLLFSSPVQSTGRAIVVTLVSAFAFALVLPFPSRHF